MRPTYELSQVETQMVNEFISRHPEVNHGIACKFLLGRKFDMDRAEQCYQNYRKAVTKHHLQNVSVNEVLEELRTRKLLIPGGRDRQGAAIFIINAAAHVPGQFPEKATLKLAYFLGEVLLEDAQTQHSGVTIISNMKGMEWANFDNQFQKTIINFFTDSIPCRVKNIILYQSPWWVTMMVRMVSPFLKAKMRERIHICDEGELFQFVDPSQMPKEFGGTLKYDHEKFIRVQMAKLPTSNSLFPLRTISPKAGGDLPPGTMMLISDEMAQRLREERSRVLHELDNKLAARRKSLHEHSIPPDATRMILSRAARMSVDYGDLPGMRPNLLQMRDGRIDKGSVLVSGTINPLAERPGEDYDPVTLRARIKDSIRKDREEHLERIKLLSSPSQPVRRELDQSPIMEPVPISMPNRPHNAKSNFSKLVELKE